MPIKFYSTTDEYGCFSELLAASVHARGQTLAHERALLSGTEVLDPVVREEIRKAKSPMIAARHGRSRKKPLRRDWGSVKIGVMRDAVRQKFETHADIRATLLSTGDEALIEDAPDDGFWGCGPNGSGKNMLGRSLMEVRDELRRA
jgi:N-glycosidase YbiA